MRVMVIKTGGMLGQDVVQYWSGGILICPPAVPCGVLDITSLEQVRETVSCNEPQVIINCAACTAVDVAEID